MDGRTDLPTNLWTCTADETTDRHINKLVHIHKRRAVRQTHPQIERTETLPKRTDTTVGPAERHTNKMTEGYDRWTGTQTLQQSDEPADRHTNKVMD